MAIPPIHQQDALEIEAIAENHFGNQMIRGMREADTEAEIDFPIRGKIQVDGREDLMLLLSGGKKIRGRTDGAVVFESAGDFFREIVTELEIRRERDTLTDTVAVKGPVKSRIAREVPRAGLLVDDGANLPGPGIRGKLSPLVANLIGETEADGPVPFLGDSHSRPNVVAHPLDPLATLFRSENVKTCLEPAGEAACDLNGFV